MKSTLTKPTRGTLAEASHEACGDIDQLCIELKENMANAVERALRLGLRLLIIHHTGGADASTFKAALEQIEGHSFPRSTAYRWINATGRFLAQHQDVCAENGDFLLSDISIPALGSQEMRAIEQAIIAYSRTSSIRRLMLGSAATGEESRMDTLISAAEKGDTLADEILDRVAKGELTLVQAIRARAGSMTTKGKERKDPVYLDLDGATGQITGLFPRCVITLSNTFDHWDALDESARFAAKSAWKALVSKLPKDLR